MQSLEVFRICLTMVRYVLCQPFTPNGSSQEEALYNKLLELESHPDAKTAKWLDDLEEARRKATI
jgi:hypothetical protein